MLTATATAAAGGRKLAVTGPPGSGKTTLCARLVSALREEQRRVGGVLTRELRDRQGKRVGFEIEDLATGERGLLAHVSRREGPRVGKYRVNLPDVERVAVPAILRALERADLVVIDEVAPMELSSPRFVEALERALESDKPGVITFQQRSRHPLVERLRRECTVYVLSPRNRETIYGQIREALGIGREETV